MKRILSFMLLLVIPSAVALTPTNAGDLNADGKVDILDVSLVSGCLGQSATTCQSGKADPNNDNTINLFDFISVSQYWGSNYPPAAVETCGNGNCNATAGETCSVCSADCGACPPTQTCDNGIIEGTEQCDGSALGGASCISQRYDGGTLTCTAGTCVFDTAQCTVNPPSVLHPNEPAGMLPYADLTMAGAASGWTTTGNVAYVDGNTYTPTSSIGAVINPPGPGPTSPATIWQIKMPYHMTSGRGTGSGTMTGPQAKTLYFSGWYKVSSNWYGENTQPPGTGVIKMIMPEVQSTSWSAVANRLIISAAHGSGTNALTSRVAWQQIVTVNGSTGISTSYYSPKSGTGSVLRGQWHHIEFVTVANSPGVADGRFQMWLDGKETHNIQGIQYDPSADITWRRINLNSVYGGPTNPNATPDDQYIWWDHAYASYSTSQK